MGYLVKMGYKMGFPQFFVTKMDGVWVLQGPFPAHNWKLNTKTDRVPNISTHKKWWDGFRGDISMLSIFPNL